MGRTVLRKGCLLIVTFYLFIFSHWVSALDVQLFCALLWDSLVHAQSEYILKQHRYSVFAFISQVLTKCFGSWHFTLLNQKRRLQPADKTKWILTAFPLTLHFMDHWTPLHCQKHSEQTSFQPLKMISSRHHPVAPAERQFTGGVCLRGPNSTPPVALLRWSYLGVIFSMSSFQNLTSSLHEFL